MPRVVLYDYPGSICSQMARLALIEKGVPFQRRTVDIMKTAEQFEPWYVALNPKAVVPTLRLFETDSDADQVNPEAASEIVCDTLQIVQRVNSEFSGPDLLAPNRHDVLRWMKEIMALHYGVLLYSKKLDAQRNAPTIVARGKLLEALRERNPAQVHLLEKRLEGNRRMQASLKDPAQVKAHIETARQLVSSLNEALSKHAFVAGESYSLADCFATAALARFRLHGFGGWRQGDDNPNLANYYERVRARSSFAEAEVIESGNEKDL